MTYAEIFANFTKERVLHCLAGSQVNQQSSKSALSHLNPVLYNVKAHLRNIFHWCPSVEKKKNKHLCGNIKLTKYRNQF